MFKRIFLLCTIVFSVGFFQCTQAAGLTISPPKFEYEIEPGGSVQGEIKIVNDEATPLILSTKVEDFIAEGETGTPVFVEPEENDASISLGKWVEITTEQITVPANAKTMVPFTISVPANAEPGGHYGTIFFAPPGGDGQLSVVQRIGSLVLVRVKGDIKEEGALETYGTFVLSETLEKQIEENYEKSQGGEEPLGGNSTLNLAQQLKNALENAKFQDLTEKGFYQTTPVDFRLRYRNDGNVHLKPTGKIEIFNMFGTKVEKVGLENILNDQGVLKDQKIVDYIPVNQGLGNVLAHSTRMFKAQFNGEAFWYRFDDGTKELRYKGLSIGKYTAKLTLNAANGEAIQREISFIVFPVNVVIGYGLGGLLVLFIFIKFFKWRSRVQRDKIKAELKKEMEK